jgi:tetratricopeptide (TPR) repeat protein
MRNWCVVAIAAVVLAGSALSGCGKRGDDAAAGAAHMERGFALLESGDVEGALKDFAAAAELMPDSTSPIRAIGDVYNLQGKPETAIEKYREALALDPGLHEVHFMIGFVSKMTMNDMATALAEFSKAAELDSTNAMYQYQLGDVLHNLERYDDAMRAFRRAIAIEPDHGGAHYSIGELYEMHMDMPEEAFSWYEKAVAIDPEMATLREMVGMSYARHGRYEEALKHFQEFLKLAPESPSAQAVEEAIRYIESQEGVTP